MTRISNLAPKYPGQHWKGGEYFAFSHADPKKEGLPADAFAFTIDIGEDAPDGTLITCVTPESRSAKGPRGYASIRHGNVANGPPPVTVPPRQIGKLTKLQSDFDLSFNGFGEANVLFDSFFLRDPKDANSKALETGVMPLPGPDALNYAKFAGKLIGTMRDHFSVTWNVVKYTSGYVMFLPDKPALRGALDEREMLRWLMSKGEAIGDLWWTGTALGLEPTAGVTQLRINRWSHIVT